MRIKPRFKTRNVYLKITHWFVDAVLLFVLVNEDVNTFK